ATLQIQTLDGPANIDIRPGTQSGQTIPLYGQGSSHLHSTGRGDLVIHVTVETPMKLEPDQEDLLKQLARMRGEESPPGKFAPGARAVGWGSAAGPGGPPTGASGEGVGGEGRSRGPRRSSFAIAPSSWPPGRTARAG